MLYFKSLRLMMFQLSGFYCRAKGLGVRVQLGFEGLGFWAVGLWGFIMFSVRLYGRVQDVRVEDFRV